MKLLCLSSPVSVGLDHTTGLKLLVLQCVAKESAEALSRVDGNRHLPHPKKASCWIVETADGYLNANSFYWSLSQQYTAWSENKQHVWQSGKSYALLAAAHMPVRSLLTQYISDHFHVLIDVPGRNCVLKVL